MSQLGLSLVVIAAILRPAIGDARQVPILSSDVSESRQGPIASALPVVNPRNGNLLLAHTDISLPGAGFSLEISRTYNSRSTQASQFGFGWSFSYGTRLLRHGNHLEIMEPDGATTAFRPAAAKTYRSDAGETIEDTGTGYIAIRRFQVRERFDRDGRLLSRADRKGNTATLQYGRSGLESVSMGNGRILRFAHDPRGLIIRMTDVLGRTWRYEYDGARNLIAATAAAGAKTTYAYDELHNLTRITYPNKTALRIAYDKQTDWVVAEDGPDTRHKGYRYQVKAAGHETIITDGLGRETRYEYDGTRVTTVDPGGGRTVSSTCAGCPGPEQIVDANGHRWNYSYDGRGNVVKAVAPDGASWEFGYDTAGLLVSRKAPRGGVARIVRDSHGNPVRFTDAAGRFVELKYDTRGNVIELVDPAGELRRYRYDGMGNLVEVTRGNGGKTELKRDGAGRIVEVRDAQGRVDRYRYNPEDRLAAYNDPLGRDFTFAHDPLGNLTAFTTPGLRQTNTYDAANRLVSHADAGGKVTTYQYDRTGQMVRRTMPDGVTSAYRYDPAGRLVHVSGPGDDVMLTYDPAGRLVEAKNPNAHYVYTYDAPGRVTSVEFRHLGRRLHYTYDSDGNRTSVALDGARPTTFEYDPSGFLTRLQAPGTTAVEFERDRGGRLHKIVYPNGLTTVYGYGAAGALASIATSDRRGTQVSAIRYGSDLSGQKVAREQSSGARVAYRHDAAGQLLAAGDTSGYAYDPRGNRVQTTGPAPAKYRYDAANQLLESGGEHFQHDARGNLVQRGSGTDITRYEYDFNNHLIAVHLPHGKTVRYAYGPLGERVKAQNTAGEVTHFMYDGLNLYATLDGSLKLTARYHAFGLDRYTSVEHDGRHFFFHTDHVGTVHALTDNTGATVRTYEYEAFGSVRSRSADDRNPLLFTGRPFDAEVGLYDLRHRALDPRLGRFLQRDPLPSINPYAYADNDPINRVDPLGLSTELGSVESLGGLGAGGLGAWIWIEYGAATVVTVLGVPITGAVIGGTLVVVGGAIAIKGVLDIWGTANTVGNKVNQTTGTIGGTTLQDAMGDGPTSVPTPCPSPSPPPPP